MSAQDASWSAEPPNDDWNDPANWGPGAVPTGTATFGPSSRTRIRFLYPAPPADSQPETRIGTMRFEAGAPAYEFIVANCVGIPSVCSDSRGRRLVFTGAGIDNQSGNRPVFTILGSGSRPGGIGEMNTVEFQNASSAGNAIFRIGEASVSPGGGGGRLVFTDSSTAGSASIENRWELYFQGSSRAGTAQIANHWVMIASGNASLDQATITNESGGVTLRDTATADRAAITNSRALLAFYNTTAGSATIINNPGVPRSALLPNCVLITTSLGSVCSDQPTLFSATIFQAASAGNARITNNAGNNEGSVQGGFGPPDPRFDLRNSTATIFDLDSTAANATITNNGGTGEDVRLTITGTGADRVITGNNTAVTFFADGATAGNATIVNNRGAWTVFLDDSTAAAARITTNAGGNLNFRDASNAGGATIANEGVTTFFDSSRAGTATITNLSGFLQFTDSASADRAIIDNRSLLQFYDQSSAAGATIVSSSILEFFDDATAADAVISSANLMSFSDASRAANAMITLLGGRLSFFDTSSADQAVITINAGATVSFSGDSSGGTSRLINNAGGTINISGHAAPGVTVGSVEGAGSIFLGSRRLTLGGNGRSTEISGVISDGGAGGSLVKAGTGTLTLSGANLYTGPTTAAAGTLLVNGSVLGPVTVNAGATLGGGGAVGATTIESGGTLAPGQSIGTLTVNGNLLFGPNSRFLVEVAPSAADRVNVTGTATLAGLLTAIATGGSYAFGEFTLLSATGGITGQFDGFSTQGSFGAFIASLRYDPNNVFLTLAAPSACPGTTDTITYSGNNSGGIEVTPPDCYRRLVVENLTHDIAPAADVDGIRLVNVTRDVAIDVTAPDRTIRVNGDFARGIYAESAGSDISVTNDAAIVTSRETTLAGGGRGAHGIYVVNPAGRTNIVNSGALDVTGFQSSAIRVDAEGAGADTVTISNSGAITLLGDDAGAIDVRMSAGSTVTIDNSGDMNLTRLNVPNADTLYGIRVTGQGPDTLVDITNSGRIVSVGPGIYVDGRAGIADAQERFVTRIVNSGDLEGFRAIYVNGGSTSVVNEGRIDATLATGGFSAVSAGITVGTVGAFREDDLTSPFLATSFRPTDLSGSAAIDIVNRGQIAVADNSAAIRAYGYDIAVTNAGALSTTGNFAPAIFVAGINDIRVAHSGSIRTNGVLSHGVEIISLNAFAGEDDLVELVISGSIEASGEAAFGANIFFMAGTGTTYGDGSEVPIGGTGSANEGRSIVTVEAGGRLIGGSGDAGIGLVVGPGRLNILDNRGTVTSLSNNGVLGGSGSELILNRGTIGAMDLAGGDDEVQLFAGGSFTGAVDGGAGTDTFRLEGDAGTSGTLDLTVARLLNFETFAKNGAGTWTLTGSQATGGGMFAVNAGRLLVNGDARGFGFTVQNGAILGGTGTLGDLIIASGGTLAPGNSIGGLNAAGNVVFRAGSFYELEIAAAGGGDRLSATGTATIEGGTVRVLTLDPETQYAGGTRYTFLSAAGGLTGTFAGLVENSAFLDFTLGYDATSAFLTIDLVQTFPDVALTFNQRQVSTALMGFDTQGGADGLAVYNQLLMLDEAAARNAFDLSSGEIYAVTLALALRHGGELSARLLGRAALAHGEGWSVWGGIEGDDGRVEGDGNGARFTRDGFGGALGIDRRGAGNRWAAGFSAGWRWTGIRLDPRSSEAEGDHWHVGGYARYGTGGEGLTAALSVAHLSGEAEVTRTIAFGTLSRTATARVDLDATALAGDLRFGLPLGGGLAAGPAARIVHVRGGLDRFAETGAASLDLSGGGDGEGRTRYGGGAFVNWQGARGAVDLVIAYERGGASPTEIGLVMTGAPNSPYRVRAARGDGDAGRFALSGHYDLGGGWTVGGDAEALIGSRERSLRGGARIGYAF